MRISIGKEFTTSRANPIHPKCVESLPGTHPEDGSRARGAFGLLHWAADELPHVRRELRSLRLKNASHL